MPADHTLYLSQIAENTDHPVRWAFFSAARMLQAGRASLLLPEASGAFVVAASAGLDERLIPSIRIRPGEGIAGIVAQDNIVLLGNVQDTSFISVPIATTEGVAGVLNFTNPLHGQPFTEADLELARSVADHIAYILEQPEKPAELHASPTALSDRARFIQALNQELARSRRLGMEFVVAGIRFDLQTGAGGPHWGALLQNLGLALKDDVRPYDVVGAYDDTITLLLPGVQVPGDRIVQRLMPVLRAIADQHGAKIVPRIGVAHYPMNGTDAEELLRAAGAR